MGATYDVERFGDPLSRMLDWQERSDRQRQAEAAEVQGEIWAEVPNDLKQAVLSAREALQEAESDVQSAQRALQMHEATVPAVGAAVAKWARRKGELEDELSAYEGIAERARQGLQRADQELGRALGRAYAIKEQGLREALETAQQEGQAEIREAEAALQAVRERAMTRSRLAGLALQRWERHRP